MNNNTLFKVRTLKDSQGKLPVAAGPCNWVSRLHYWDVMVAEMSSLLIWLPGAVPGWRLVNFERCWHHHGSYRRIRMLRGNAPTNRLCISIPRSVSAA